MHVSLIYVKFWRMKAGRIDIAFFEKDQYLFPINRRSKNPIVDYKNELVKKSIAKELNLKVKNISLDSIKNTKK
ncbi:hypothetical protein ABMA70_05295 [Halobacteriovorax sp. XZX-3]|uniref:hypothetical protein n=2 Tax=unclassified Halobacteriovorax TaxID=2639665 RepID=UPI000CD06E9D|nr:hypothetical protein [Halobacteriovorax sp. DA5]POB15089.1 hypothetical protein C0Z22_01545 [Halobacteriovorax sp. DA5]